MSTLRCGIDVLSNREVVDIVASSPARSSAARSLVESAVRAWKFKYPTSKIDDCAAVCLFLTNSDDVAASSSMSENTCNIKTKETSIPTTALDQSDTKKSRKGKDTEEAILKEHVMADGNSTTAEDWDEWSALEGVPCRGFMTPG